MLELRQLPISSTTAKRKQKENMIKEVRHLSGRDKRALAVFFGIAFLCWLYFASGILVTKDPSLADEIEMAKDGTGYTVRVSGLREIGIAEQLSKAIRDQRRVQTRIEQIPKGGGYLIDIGPVAKLWAAEALTTELHNSGFNIVKIVENCRPGGDCGPAQVNNQSR
jgi:hypothetical protein